MADPAFWRELAETFLLIPSHEMIRAEGQYRVGSGEPWSWRLAGYPTEFVVNKFEDLAIRGAFEIAPVGTTDFVGAWLEEIRKERINFRSDLVGPEYVGGIIDRVCEASAILCRKLAARAVQAEFDEKHRNDPRNWSPFRREYEALKSIKQLRDAPPERIPESFVRSALARIYGIKPEEVTWKQIKFEIAGLIPFYPSIELIPEPPPPQSADAPSIEQPTADDQPKPMPPPSETIAAQLQKLRDECRWTIPQLAEAVRIDPRTVDRHLAGDFSPYPKTLSAYERAFSKHLKRKVVIKKMP